MIVRVIILSFVLATNPTSIYKSFICRHILLKYTDCLQNDSEVKGTYRPIRQVLVYWTGSNRIKQPSVRPSAETYLF
jgi:hypothetical protein